MKTPRAERRRLRALGLRVNGEPLDRAREINPRQQFEDLGDGPIARSVGYTRPERDAWDRKRWK